jgi:hypothetical protein
MALHIGRMFKVCSIKDMKTMISSSFTHFFLPNILLLQAGHLPGFSLKA